MAISETSLHQHGPALISVDKRRDSIYGQQCWPAFVPTSRHVLDRPTGINVIAW